MLPRQKLINQPAPKAVLSRIKKGIKYWFSSGLHEIGKTVYLEIAAYEVAENKSEPIFRTFFEPEGKHISCKAGRWLHRPIGDLRDDYCHGCFYDKDIDITKKDALLIAAYLNIKNNNKSKDIQKVIIGEVNIKMMESNRERYWEKKDAAESTMQENFTLLPDLPDDFVKHVRKNCLPNSQYLFYSTLDKDHDRTVTCSVCGSTYSIGGNEPAHNMTGFCKGCLSLAIYKKAWLNRSKMTDVGLAAIIQPYQNGFIGRFFEVALCYQTNDRGDLKLRERGRYFMDTIANKAYTYLQEWEYDECIGSYYYGYRRDQKDPYAAPAGWRVGKRFRLPANQVPGYYRGELHSAVLYAGNLPEIITGTRFSCIETSEEYDQIGLIERMYYFTKYPVLEYLKKMGFKKLVGQITIGWWLHLINPRGKTPEDIMRMPKSAIKMLSKMDPEPRTIETVQLLEKKGLCIKQSQFQIIISGGLCSEPSCIESLGKILDHTSLEKAFNYHRKQQEIGKVKNILSNWADYIDECTKLNYDLNDSQILMPKDLILTHARTSALIEHKHNASLNRKIAVQGKKSLKKYTYESEKYLITAPMTALDMIYEGKALRHCVGRYADNVAEGRTVILFIRAKAEPEIPFYTMEIKNGAIYQCHTQGNRDYITDPEMTEFVEAFKTAKLDDKPSKMKIAV
ncbi:MAG TPA: hypothetical protein DIT32_03550 [Peptococcaceae bacterium]|nr:hypothetical protein [Peptococcaceae bacterium]